MVRVFSVYNFTEQHTSTADDVIDADLLNSDTIILAKANQIEIKKLNNSDEGSNIKFHSVDEVQKIVYSKHGNFIGTLERNDMGNSFVRVYTNWSQSESINSTQISARIANLVTPNNNRSGTMEMIELPFAEQPNLFSICQATGNILVTSQQYMYLYRFKHYEKKKYIDFEECPFRIEVEFQPKIVAVCENLIAMSSFNSFLLIKLCDIRFGNEVSNSESSISSDPSEKSDHFGSDSSLLNQQIDLHNNLDFAKLSQLKYVNGELLRVSIQSKLVTPDESEKSNTESQNELQLTTVNNIRFELQYLMANGEYSASVETVDEQMKFVVQPILQLKLIPLRFDEKMHIPDAFVCLKLRPLYDATDSVNLLPPNDSDDQFFMKSRFAHKFRGLMFVLCTSSDGYLYQIEEPKPDCNFFLTHYDSMSSQIKDVAIANGVLHVATDLGLETYSLPKLTINSHHTAEHSSSNSNTCLFGLRPFPYLKKTLSEGDALVLLAHVISTPLPEVTDTVSIDSSAGETKNFFQKAISKSISAYTATSNNLARKPHPSSVATANWTIYSLKNPPISQLYVDFLELANKNYEKSPLVYAHLLFCVHSILCDTKLFANLAKNDQKIGFDATYSELQQHWSPELEELYKQSCSSLADFFINTDNEYQYAFEFYTKAGIGLSDIFIRSEKRSKEPHVGLIWTLRKFLVELIMTNTDTMIEMLNSPLEMDNKTLRFGDAFLEFLAKWNPPMISDLYLSFEVFRCVISEKTYEILLRADLPRSNQGVVCICLHLIRKDEIGTALKLLESVTLNDLRHILTVYWQLLFEPALTTNQRRKMSKVSSFSFFTEVCFLQNPNTDFQKLLVDVLIEILFSYRIEFEDVLKTCFVDYMSGLAGSSKHSAACQCTMLMFLEKYFTRLHAINRNLAIKGIKPYSAVKSETTTTSSYLLGGAPNESVDAQDFPSLEETSSIAELELISREKEPQTSLVNNEGIKILIRIYLGQLRLYAMKRKTYAQSHVATKPEFAMKNVKVLESEINQFVSVAKTANYAEMRQIILTGSDGDDTPILFLEERYDFLNLIPPFYRNIIGEGDRDFELSKSDQNTFLITTIKIQSLLCNKKILSEETRREIVHFLQTNNEILGIDLVVALKVCILNKQHALELLLNNCPQGILSFAKKRFVLDSEWTYIIKSFKEKISSYAASDENYFYILAYQKFLREILEFLATSKPLETVLKIFPPTESDNASHNDVDLDDYIRLCVETESSGKISIMIQNTGQQLWNLVKNKNN